MICPKCKELGQKSTITIGPAYTTAMYCPPYYDEDGKLHSHDYNKTSEVYNCSQGHTINVTRSTRCPNCYFGNDTVTKVYERNGVSTSAVTLISNERIDAKDFQNVRTIKIDNGSGSN